MERPAVATTRGDAQSPNLAVHTAPAAVANPGRYRLAVGLAVASVVVGMGAAIACVLTETYRELTVTSLVAVAVGAWWLLSADRANKIDMFARVNCLLGIGSTIAFTYIGGVGLAHPAVPVLATVPILALALLSHREAVSWCGLCVLTLVVLAVATADAAAEITVAGNFQSGMFDIITLVYIFAVGRALQASRDVVAAKLTATERSLEATSAVAAKSRELSAANDALADANRSLELLNVELAEASSAAQAASNAKTAFLANMSHEIRTPMNGIVGMSELLMVRNIEPHLHEMVEVIHTSGLALVQLMNDVLDLARVEADSLAINVAPLDVYELCDSVVRLFQVEATTKGLHLTLTFAQRSRTTVMGDATRLRQVLVNVLGNAVKFTEEGSINLLVSDSPDRADAVEFRVTDTGIGIQSHELETMFDRFTQADDSLSRRFGGAGLRPRHHQEAGQFDGRLHRGGQRSRAGHDSGGHHWIAGGHRVPSGCPAPQRRAAWGQQSSVSRVGG